MEEGGGGEGSRIEEEKKVGKTEREAKQVKEEKKVRKTEGEAKQVKGEGGR